MLRSRRMAPRARIFIWSTSWDVAPPVLNPISRRDKRWLPLALALPHMCSAQDLVQARPRTDIKNFVSLEAVGPWDVIGRIWPNTWLRPYLRVFGNYGDLKRRKVKILIIFFFNSHDLVRITSVSRPRLQIVR